MASPRNLLLLGVWAGLAWTDAADELNHISSEQIVESVRVFGNITGDGTLERSSGFASNLTYAWNRSINCRETAKTAVRTYAKQVVDSQFECKRMDNGLPTWVACLCQQASIAPLIDWLASECLHNTTAEEARVLEGVVSQRDWLCTQFEGAGPLASNTSWPSESSTPNLAGNLLATLAGDAPWSDLRRGRGAAANGAGLGVLERLLWLSLGGVLVGACLALRPRAAAAPKPPSTAQAGVEMRSAFGIATP